MTHLKSYPTLASDDDSGMLKLSRKIETGFPSPAGDHLEKALSLEELIVRRPTSTFYVRAEGDAMKASGIFDGDILVVDRSLNPHNGAILIVSLDEEVIIRRFVKKGKRIFLVTGDVRYAPIPINEGTEWMVWGVATHLIHRFSNRREEERAQEEKVYEM